MQISDIEKGPESGAKRASPPHQATHVAASPRTILYSATASHGLKQSAIVTENKQDHSR